ncbi:MAG TPA: hypothetical protein VLJ68_10640, partial [Chitinophagaceae bacterium]|nr:hypothetical protein [Chitinophagaceae bacterium]
WQLYHDQFDGVNDGFVSWKPRGELNGYNAVAKYPFDRWLHVKMLIKGTEAELYLDNNSEPVAFIKELKMGQHPGSIGVESGVGNVYFSNFTYSKTDDVVFKSKPTVTNPATVPGTIGSWQVSTIFKESDIKSKNQFDEKWLNSFTWRSLKTEKGDFINISRLATVADSINTVLVKLVVNADKDQIKRLDIGYSDRVKAFCNGNAMYSGNSSFRTRDFRHLGTMGYFDAIYLPLRKGENTIILAVSETFGGWGLMGKFENLEGIRIVE